MGSEGGDPGVGGGRLQSGEASAGIGELGSYRGARGSSETCTPEGQLWKQCEEGWAAQVALVGKNPPAGAGDTGSIRVGKIPWSRKRHPLQHPCLENSVDRGAWRATVMGSQRVGTPLLNVR